MSALAQRLDIGKVQSIGFSRAEPSAAAREDRQSGAFLPPATPHYPRSAVARLGPFRRLLISPGPYPFGPVKDRPCSCPRGVRQDPRGGWTSARVLLFGPDRSARRANRTRRGRTFALHAARSRKCRCRQDCLPSRSRDVRRSRAAERVTSSPIRSIISARS
jgi:hypothetical protein